MRATFNRQARREALCIRARSRRRHKRAAWPGRVWLTAYGHDLARVAERIEFELPADLVRLLSPAGLPAPAGPSCLPRHSTSGQAPHGDVQALSGRVRER